MSFVDSLKSLSTPYPNIAYVFAALGYCFQAFLQIAFKYVARVVPPFHTLFMRAFCLFILNNYILSKTKESPYIRNPYVFRQLLKRLVFSTSYAVIVYYCVRDLPVSTVQTLSNTGPIFIFFIEAIYYNRALNKISLAFTVLSFLGVMLILQPEFLFPRETGRIVENFEFLSMMVIVAAFCFSMSMVYVHEQGKNISTVVNLHYSYVSHMLLTGLLSNMDPPSIDASQITLALVFAFVMVVILALLAQYMIFAATSLKEPSYTMPLGYLSIVIGFLADIIFFKVEFNYYTVIGMLLTSAGLLSKLFLADTRKDNTQGGSIHDGETPLEEKRDRKSSLQQQLQKI